MMKISPLLLLLFSSIFYSGNAFAKKVDTVCDAQYRYFIDDDDKVDILTSKIGSYLGDTPRCKFELHLSKENITRSFYLNSINGFISFGKPRLFDSAGLLKAHKKDEISIYYRKNNYKEIHHFKLLNNQLYIDSIDLYYSDKKTHKTVGDVLWGIKTGDFLVKSKSDTNETLLNEKDFYKLSNQQILSIIKSGGGSYLLWYLKNNSKKKEYPYFALYLSKIFKQFGLLNKSKSYYLNYLSNLSNYGIKPDPLMTGGNDVENTDSVDIKNKFKELPDHSTIEALTSGDINNDGSIETAVLSFVKNKGYKLQVYKNDNQQYHLIFSSPLLKSYENEQHDNYKYYIETDEEKSLDLAIENGYLHFTIQARGREFTDHRYITPYFSIKNNQLILQYSQNVWQVDGERTRKFFTIDYDKKLIIYFADYEKQKNTTLESIHKKLPSLDYRSFALAKPITLDKFSFFSPIKNVLETSYSDYAKESFDKKFTLAKKYYQQKTYYKVLSLFNSKSIIDANLKNYPISKANIQRYNDIAYFLQKANAHKNALFLLSKIIKYDPDRIVAYLNIYDSYVALNEPYTAKPYLFSYLKKMHKAQKDKKIPKRIIDKYSILVGLSHNKTIDKLLSFSQSDLNNDGENDIALAYKMPQGERRLILLTSTKKGAVKAFDSVQSIENIKHRTGADFNELSGLEIKDNKLIVQFSDEESDEEYQFQRYGDTFQLISRKNIYKESGRSPAQEFIYDYVNKVKTIKTRSLEINPDGTTKINNEIKTSKLILDTNITLRNLAALRKKIVNDYNGLLDDNY